MITNSQVTVCRRKRPRNRQSTVMWSVRRASAGLPGVWPTSATSTACTISPPAARPQWSAIRAADGVSSYDHHGQLGKRSIDVVLQPQARPLQRRRVGVAERCRRGSRMATKTFSASIARRNWLLVPSRDPRPPRDRVVTSWTMPEAIPLAVGVVEPGRSRPATSAPPSGLAGVVPWTVNEIVSPFAKTRRTIGSHLVGRPPARPSGRPARAGRRATAR